MYLIAGGAFMCIMIQEKCSLVHTHTHTNTHTLVCHHQKGEKC